MHNVNSPLAWDVCLLRPPAQSRLLSDLGLRGERVAGKYIHQLAVQRRTIARLLLPIRSIRSHSACLAHTTHTTTLLKLHHPCTRSLAHKEHRRHFASAIGHYFEREDIYNWEKCGDHAAYARMHVQGAHMCIRHTHLHMQPRVHPTRTHTHTHTP
jgi:hypothetical protein